MKGLNVKRIAALGIGAALVGSALAPAVMAGVFSNVDSLQKESIVNSTGTPVVDIVVGSMGQASDVVWAGNIAAKVAQLATVDATTGAPTVDFTVGGTTTMAGAGNVDENYLSATAPEFNIISADVTDVPTFVSGTKKIKHPELGSGYYDMSVDENAQAVLDITMQTDASKDYPGQAVGEVATQGIWYTVSLGSGIPYYATEQASLDENTAVDIKVPFLGKEYVVDTIGANGTSLVLYADTTPTDLKVGDKVSVAGAGAYAGKTLSIEFVGVFSTGTGGITGTEFVGKWNLIDGTTLLKTVQSSGTYDLKDKFGDSMIADSVHVTFIGKNEVSVEGVATIRSGSDRLELQNDKIFPFSSTASESDSLWRARLVTSGGNRITAIQLYNNKLRYVKSDLGNIDAAKGRMGPLAEGESVMIPGTQDYLKLTYLGLTSKKMSEVKVAADMTEESGKGLVITDTKGISREIPFYISLTNGSNEIMVGGKGFSVDVNRDANTIKYWDRVVEDTETATGGTSVSWADKDVSATVSFAVASNWASGDVDYMFAADRANNNYWLLLKGDQTFDVYSRGDTVTNELKFFGTDVDQNTVNGIDFNFYLPDTTTFAVLTDLNYLKNNLNQYLTGTDAPSEGNDYQYASMFTFSEVPGTQADVNIYVNNQTGELINTQDNKSKAYNTAEVMYTYWNLNENTTSASSRLLAAGTVYGSELLIDGSILTINMPEEQRKVEAYLGSTSTTPSTTGGATYTDVPVNGTEGNVTITGINGAAGKTVVSVGNIVKLDTDASSGKAIIVGGHMVNRVAATISVEGQTLKDRLVSDGDWVAAVLDNGSIVVAGWTANDTATAARELINKLESFL